MKKMQQQNKSTWNNSLRNSIVIHLLLLLIAWLFKLQHNADETIDTQYAVTVNFQQIEFNNSKSSNSTKSSAAEGKQRPKSEAPPKIESSKPKTVEAPKVAVPKPTPTPPAPKPTPTDPVQSETTTDVADIEAIEDVDIEVDDPEPEYIPESTPEPAPAEEPVVINPDVPNIEDIIGDISDDPIDLEEETDIAVEEGSNTNSDASKNNDSRGGVGSGDPSLNDGEDTGTGKGNRGSGKGNDSGGNDNDSGRGTGDHGEGEYDASGNGIFGRKIIYRDYSMIQNASSKSGKYVFKVCINRRGTVSSIEIIEAQTTIKDKKLLKAALESLRKYKYEPDPTAPREQCGPFTLKVDNFNGIGG